MFWKDLCDFSMSIGSRLSAPFLDLSFVISKKCSWIPGENPCSHEIGFSIKWIHQYPDQSFLSISSEATSWGDVTLTSFSQLHLKGPRRRCCAYSHSAFTLFTTSYVFTFLSCIISFVSTAGSQVFSVLMKILLCGKPELNVIQQKI